MSHHNLNPIVTQLNSPPRERPPQPWLPPNGFPTTRFTHSPPPPPHSFDSRNILIFHSSSPSSRRSSPPPPPKKSPLSSSPRKRCSRSLPSLPTPPSPTLTPPTHRCSYSSARLTGIRTRRRRGRKSSSARLLRPPSWRGSLRGIPRLRKVG